MSETVCRKKCGCIPWVISILLILIFSFPASAEIYVYKDRNGILHFTDTPTSEKYTIYMGGVLRSKRTAPNTSTYDDVISVAAKRNGIPFQLLKALIHVESYFNPNAVSKKGAVGLMQIMPGNFSLLKVRDPYDPWDNVMGGASYLNDMIRRFNGDLDLALAAYNAGPSAVEQYNTIPPYRETQEYVRRVLELYRFYKNT